MKVTWFFTLAVTLLSSLILSSCQPQVPAGRAIIKPQSDHREYRYVTLDNGLGVLLVRDGQAQKATVALDVNIGYLADPSNREGLSHFLEHMLFLGSEAYPEVGGFSAFVSAHGGASNASTGTEHTTYHFDIASEQLEPALDRFAGFFINPLFSPEYVEKEINAVDSEFMLNVQNDTRRYFEAIKQTKNPDHPISQFSVGNRDTLSDDANSSILEDVKAHYVAHYSADIMQLVIVSEHSLMQMEGWARDKFSEVRRVDKTPPAERLAPYREDQTGVKIYVNTLKDDKALRLVFALPAAAQHYRQKPDQYIAAQLRHRGPGGLYNHLNSKGYMRYFDVYTGGPKDFIEFEVNFGLTDKGYGNIDAIVSDFFSYVNLIKADGITQRRFDDIGMLRRLDFEFDLEDDPIAFARNSARNLQNFPPQHVLDIGQTYEDFDHKLISQYLGFITPEAARVIISGPDITALIFEPRYGADYRIEPIAPDTLSQWRAAPILTTLSLPADNPYVPETFDIVSAGRYPTPTLAYSQPGLEVYGEDQSHFNLPRANLNARIYSAKAYDSPEHHVAMALHTQLMRDKLSSENYLAEQAGLSYSLSNTSRSYNITITGYTDQIGPFLTTLLDASEPSQTSDEQYTRIQTNYIRSLKDSQFNAPMGQVFRAFTEESDNVVPGLQQKIRAAQSLDYQRFQTIIAELLSNVKIEALTVGNMRQSHIEDIAQRLAQRFDGKLSDQARLGFNETRLSPAQSALRELTIDHKDSALALMIQGDSDDYNEIAKHRIMTHLFGRRFFRSLRTEQQLGYFVSLRDYSFASIPANLFAVQSTGRHPSLLLERIEAFLEEQDSYLEDMTEAEYKTQIDGLMTKTLKEPDNVENLGRAYYSELISERRDFDSRANIAKAIGQISLEDFRQFYSNNIRSPQRRQLIIWSSGANTVPANNFEPSAYSICSESKCIAQKADRP